MGVGAAIVLQSFILYYQRNYGALVGLIPWDDCAIVLRALENLDKLAQAHSLWHKQVAALHVDIDAPVSDIHVIVGLLLAGGAIWGPYARDITCLCIAIYALSTTVALKDPVVFGTSVPAGAADHISRPRRAKIGLAGRHSVSGGAVRAV